MTMPHLRSRKTLVIAAVSLLVLGVGVWAGFTRTDNDEQTVKVPKELTVDALKASATDPQKAMETVREAFHREDLTEEQRHQVARNAHTVREAVMDERMDEYFKAGPDEKNAILDQQIDEFQKLRETWEQRRREREKERAAEKASSTDDERERDRGPRDRGRFSRPQTQQERKERSEARSPDQRGRQMAYFNALRKRMADRGLQTPRFGSRGRGGPPSRGRSPR